MLLRGSAGAWKSSKIQVKYAALTESGQGWVALYRATGAIGAVVWELIGLLLPHQGGSLLIRVVAFISAVCVIKIKSNKSLGVGAN
jgi:hypothetical protein